MRFMFVIQGEGRGHTTQAIALKQLLLREGHSICATFISGKSSRGISSLAKENFEDLVSFDSPNFAYTNKGDFSWSKTIKRVLFGVPSFLKAISLLRVAVSTFKPDVVVNFYEPMYGISNLLHRFPVRSVSIGHQFMFLHRDYRVGSCLSMRLVKLFTWLVGYGSKKLALSFYDAPAQDNITVVPPLLREELFVPQTVKSDPKAVLGYLVNQGYVPEFAYDSQKEYSINLFTQVTKVTTDGAVTVNPLEPTKFLSAMKACSFVFCTAGFETVAEAIYLGKPLFMRPVTGHVEQQLNAADAEQNVGNCKRVDTFRTWRADLQNFQLSSMVTLRFKQWVDSAPQRFLGELIR